MQETFKYCQILMIWLKQSPIGERSLAYWVTCVEILSNIWINKECINDENEV